MIRKISCKISMAEALRHWGQTSYLQKRQCIVIHNMSENEKVKKICYP